MLKPSNVIYICNQLKNEQQLNLGLETLNWKAIQDNFMIIRVNTKYGEW